MKQHCKRNQGHSVHRSRATPRFLRETNYGRIFDVKSKSSANNQAYTSQALPLHTDLCFYKHAPDIQFLHCISQGAQGGESMFLDGVAAAMKLRETDPAAYKILTTTKVSVYSDVISCTRRFMTSK